MKKIIGILIVAVLLGSLFLFVPTGQSQNIKTPFGNWTVELTGTTPCGDTVPFSTVNTVVGQIFSWSTGGQEIDHLNIKIYAQATGDGYETCELNMGTYELIALLSEPGTGVSRPVGTPLAQTFELPVNGDQVLIVDADTDLSIFESASSVDYGDTFTIKFWFRKLTVPYPGEYITFRGIESDGTEGPWQEYTDVFVINTDITLTYEEDYVPPPPSCNEPFPGQNCQSSPSECGPCNAHLTDVYGWSGGSVEGFGWSSSSPYGECNIIYKYYDVDHWSSWEAANVNDHIEVFRYRNMFAVTGKPNTEAYLRGYCKMTHPTEGTVYLEEFHATPRWSNDKLGLILPVGDWGSAYFHTNKKENHLLLSGGGWEIEMKLWFEPTGNGPNPIPPQYLTVKTSPPGDIVCVDGDCVQASQHSFLVDKGMHEAVAHWPDGSSGFTPVEIIDQPVTVTITKGMGLTMVSSSLFSIQLETTSYEKYEHNGNYLGG